MHEFHSGRDTTVTPDVQAIAGGREPDDGPEVEVRETFETSCLLFVRAPVTVNASVDE